jgi:hypothetical protein
MRAEGQLLWPVAGDSLTVSAGHAAKLLEALQPYFTHQRRATGVFPQSLARRTAGVRASRSLIGVRACGYHAQDRSCLANPVALAGMHLTAAVSAGQYRRRSSRGSEGPGPVTVRQPATARCQCQER